MDIRNRIPGDIVKQVTNGFTGRYPHFKEFQHNPEYRAYWDICMESIADKDFLLCVIFCNDELDVPPVKTFLTHYLKDFQRITGDEEAKLDRVVKQAIGAFWGMVFKFVLHYDIRESVSVSMNKYYMVKTASLFSGAPEASVR